MVQNLQACHAERSEASRHFLYVLAREIQGFFAALRMTGPFAYGADF
jgi:hypothetical protein